MADSALDLRDRGAGGVGMGGHSLPNRGESDVWLTPPKIIEALGRFDLDPCAAPEPRPWATAENHITLPENGLAEKWFGRVWLNPPYGAATTSWMKKMAHHNHGTALIFARTETECWHRHIWPFASAILFLEGRLFFHRPDGKRARHNAGAPSALVAYGVVDAVALRASRLRGFLVPAEWLRKVI